MALTDEQIEKLADKYLVGLYQNMEKDVLQDIARRVRKTGRLTETAEIMARNMHEQGCCVIVVTHDPEVAELADQVYRVRDGVLTAA